MSPKYRCFLLITKPVGWGLSQRRWNRFCSWKNRNRIVNFDGEVEMKRLSIKLALVGILILCSFSIAFADSLPWYFELRNTAPTDVSANSFYSQEIYFHSQGNAYNLNSIFLSVDYDEAALEFAAYLVAEHKEGTPPFRKKWDDPLGPLVDVPPDMVQISSVEPLPTIPAIPPFVIGPGDTLLGTV